MFAALVKPIDHVSLRLATMSVRGNEPRDGEFASAHPRTIHTRDALVALEQWGRAPEDFFAPPQQIPNLEACLKETANGGSRHAVSTFQFPSACASPYPR